MLSVNGNALICGTIKVVIVNSFYIKDVTDVGNLLIEIAFSDNTLRVVNIGDLIQKHPHPQYIRYLDPKRFTRFKIANGNVVRGKDWDLIFPIEQLYGRSPRLVQLLLPESKGKFNFYIISLEAFQRRPLMQVYG